MPQFSLLTIEHVRRGYKIEADTAEEAQEIFENGDATEPAYDDVLDVEITEVREVEDE